MIEKEQVQEDSDKLEVNTGDILTTAIVHIRCLSAIPRDLEDLMDSIEAEQKPGAQ